MKRKILSLVAFMAFSVSAFANTVESKEEVVEVKSISLIWEPMSACEKLSIAVSELASDLGFSDEKAGEIAYAAFVACEAE